MQVFKNHSIAVVIPCYKVEQQIQKVVGEIPDYITSIILVHDASPDKTGEILEQLSAENSKITVEQIAGSLKTTKRRIEYYINQLKKSGLVKCVGSKKTGHWVVKSVELK